VILFRHADPRFPFLWDTADQPAARWHAAGAGPVQYLADTPDGAWAEFLRHEEIRERDDLATIRRALWAVEVDDVPNVSPELPSETLTGGRATYGACREEARRLREEVGVPGFWAPSAALVAGAASGYTVDGGMNPGPARDGRVVVLFGRRPDIVGWAATIDGRPGADLLTKVRHFEG
jgi:hypothetical protein